MKKHLLLFALLLLIPAAMYAADEFIVTVSANPANGGTVHIGDNPDAMQDTIQAGRYCTIHATNHSGYTFVNWTENGNVVSTEQDYGFEVYDNHDFVANFTVQTQTYTISVSANPSNGGTVSGGGTYTYGQICTVCATANSGYTFTNWTENGNIVSTSACCTLTVNSNHTLVANFTAQTQTYTINVSASPSNGGTVSGGGTYQQGQQCTVQANANNGYTFVKWTENGNQVSTNANYTFTVTGNRNLVAVFQGQTYTISVSANPSNGGSVSGGGNYSYGQSCTVHATPNTGFIFSHWTENGSQVSTNADYNFTVTGNRTLVAHFTTNQQTYTIHVVAQPEEGGTVNGDGTYAAGVSCTVKATANSGYIFTNWTEDDIVVSSNTEFTFTVNADRTLVAHFEEKTTYTITVSANPTNGGSVSGGGTYAEGVACTVTATANEGYSFVNWTENDVVVFTEAEYPFTVTADRTLVANFTANQPQSYTISVEVQPEEGGIVSGDGTYQQGESCTLTATANTGYTFIRWAEDGAEVSTAEEYTFTVEGDRNLVAEFQQQTYTISVTIDPIDGGTVSGTGTYTYGQQCILTARANPGYAFLGWKENGNLVSTNPSFTFIVTGIFHDLVATFIANTYTITVSANPTEGGTVDGGGTYLYGEFCSVHAMPNAGYAFVNWTENNAEVSYFPDYGFTVTNSSNLVAHFVQTMTIGDIETPGTICDNEPLDLINPTLNDSLTGEWQLSPDTTFVNAITYHGEALGQEYDGWSLRYIAYNETDTIGSNIVTIAVQSFINENEISEIVAKGPARNKYMLIYPDPKDGYQYQWYHNNDVIPGANKQYYYKKGGLENGSYKVYISYNSDAEGRLVCGAFSPAEEVSNGSTNPNRLSVFPNPSPTGTRLVIMNDSEEEALLSIYSVDGKLIYSQTVTDIQATVDIILPQGIYVARLTNGQNVKVEKIVIQ
jgi:uncharacterized repeat protein (TIGR02543 family)